MTELTAGSTLAGLRIEGVLGRGGMGVVYRALDPDLDRQVAVKVIAGSLAADADFRRRFRRESRTAASVHHPHVIPIHRAGEEDGLLFLVMQHVAGTDLRELIDRSGRLDPIMVGAVVGQVAAALDAAHRQGLVHCDVKPANVLVSNEDGRPHAYLTDFGLTRQVDSSERITRTGVLLGSFDYMAPELFDRAPPSVASDVYALGCMAFHALSGSVPHPRPNVGAMIAAHLHAPAPGLDDAVPEPALRAALDRVVATAMAKRPAERYPSAGALAAALREALGTGGQAPESEAPVEDAGVPRHVPTVVTPSVEETSGYPPPTAGPRFGPPPERLTLDRTVPNPTVPNRAPPNRAAPHHAAPDRTGPPDRTSTAGEPPRPPAGPRFAPPPGTAPDPEPPTTPTTAPKPTRNHRRRARWRWIVAIALLAGAALATVLVLVTTSGPPTTAAPAAIVLDPPVSSGASVRLTWSGPDTLDYAVVFTSAGSAEETVVVGRAREATVPVTPGVPHCFRIRGTDAQSVRSSNVQPLDGADCG